MGIVVNFTARTVAGFTYPGLEEFPVVIRDANEVHITFTGSNESGSSIVAGDINRVTGELWASSTMRDANTSKIVTSCNAGRRNECSRSVCREYRARGGAGKGRRPGEQ